MEDETRGLASERLPVCRTSAAIGAAHGAESGTTCSRCTGSSLRSRDHYGQHAAEEKPRAQCRQR